VEDDPADGDDHLRANLEKAVSEGPDLGSGAGRSSGAEPQLLHEDIGGGGEQDPKLVGPEAGATGPVDLQAVMEFLDAVLDLPTAAIDLLVDPLGGPGEIADDEAGVLLGFPTGMPDHFGFDDDPALMLPGLGPVAALSVDVLGFFRFRERACVRCS